MTWSEGEHGRLLRMTEALQREHDALRDSPHDREAHRAHRDKLLRHIEDLHDYVARLRGRGDSDD